MADPREMSPREKMLAGLSPQEQRNLFAQDAAKYAAIGLGAPFVSVLPFLTEGLSSNSDQIKNNIKFQEAQRLFPSADPSIFDLDSGNQTTARNPLVRTIIPKNQHIAYDRAFQGSLQGISQDALYMGRRSPITFLDASPDAPSPELGSHAKAIQAGPFSEHDLRITTVTPNSNSQRFAQDYAAILSEKLGNTQNKLDQLYLTPEESPEINSERNRLETKARALNNKIPGQAGYLWGNTDRPQYSYASNNNSFDPVWGSNPSIYTSRINANPSWETGYKTTGYVESRPDRDLRNQYKVNPYIKKEVGPSWGQASNQDVHYTKDLIQSRGELTTGDLQALLHSKGQQYFYQSYEPGSSINDGSIDPASILKNNLTRLAKADGISEAEAIAKYSRVVPNIGNPSTPPTAAITGRSSSFPGSGQAMSPDGSYDSKLNLRKIGIMPPENRRTYSVPFDIDTEFEDIYPRTTRYGASHTITVPTAEGPVGELRMHRDVLRPLAANKLLNRTTEKLIAQGKGIKGFGVGGLATGIGLTALDPNFIKATAANDIEGALNAAGTNIGISTATGFGISKGLQGLQALGYARPAAFLGNLALPVTGAVMAGLGLVETGKALNQIYKERTGKDFNRRNYPPPETRGPTETPTIVPRMGTATLNGKPVNVPYGSVAGMKKVGRPWWDTVGTAFTDVLNHVGMDRSATFPLLKHQR